jgi:hypothetical protein
MSESKGIPPQVQRLLQTTQAREGKWRAKSIFHEASENRQTYLETPLQAGMTRSGLNTQIAQPKQRRFGPSAVYLQLG